MIILILLYLHLDILRTLTYLKPKAYAKHCQISKMTRHIENPGIFRTVYSGISKDIQQYSGILRKIKAYSSIIVAYWAIFRYIQNPYLWNRTTFRILAYLKPEETSKAWQTCNKSCTFRDLALSEQFLSIFNNI